MVKDRLRTLATLCCLVVLALFAAAPGRSGGREAVVTRTEPERGSTMAGDKLADARDQLQPASDFGIYPPDVDEESAAAEPIMPAPADVMRVRPVDPASPLQPRTSTTSFSGLDLVTGADNGWPGGVPDTQLAASHNDVIEMVNKGIRLSSTTGTPIQTQGPQRVLRRSLRRRHRPAQHAVRPEDLLRHRRGSEC